MLHLNRLALLATAVLFAACSAEPASTPVTEPDITPVATEAASPAQHTEPAGMPQRAAAPEGAEVYFVSPADGDEIEGEVKVVFGLRNMEIAPAGVMTENTGHHHLLINAPQVSMDEALPTTEQVVHFGAGQTETTLSLPPGEHSLQLLLGDGLHRPHNPPVISETIHITVK